MDTKNSQKLIFDSNNRKKIAKKCYIDESKQTLLIFETGTNKTIKLELNSTITDYKINQYDEKLGSGYRIEISTLNFLTHIIYLLKDTPYILIQKNFLNDSDKDVILEESIYPHVKLDLPNANTGFGVDGIKSLKKPNTLYLFEVIGEKFGNSGAVIGWISQNSGSGILTSKPIKKSSEKSIEIIPKLQYGSKLIDKKQPISGELLAIGYFDDVVQGLEKYADLIKVYYDIELPPIPKGGYCTWYASEHNAAADQKSMQIFADYCSSNLKDYGFEIQQIDDGWQEGPERSRDNGGPRADFATHDENGPYPNGMALTAKYIKNQGFIPGIWLLPFAWDPLSKTMKENEDLFVRKKNGEIYQVKWAGWCLDMTNPDAREHLKKTIHRITSEWGYDYLKLDGLWSGLCAKMLYPEPNYRPDNLGDAIFYDTHKSNIEAYRTGLEVIREGSKKGTYLLGCNIAQNMRTLGASMGLLDAMRVGKDVGAHWRSIMPCIEMGSRLFFFHGKVWHNDPDCLMLRKPLKYIQARTWGSWIGLTGQLNIVSEWLPSIPNERVEIFKRTIPNTGLCGKPLDILENDPAKIWQLTEFKKEKKQRRDIFGFFHYQGKRFHNFIFNLDKLKNFDSKSKQYIAYNFWDDKWVEIEDNTIKLRVKKGDCKIIAVQPILEHPQILSTSRHISQGIVDIIAEEWFGNELKVKCSVIAEDPYIMQIYSKQHIINSVNVDGQLERKVEKIDFYQEEAKIEVKIIPKTTCELTLNILFEKKEK